LFGIFQQNIFAVRFASNIALFVAGSVCYQEEIKRPSLHNYRDGLPKLVPGAGIEPARLAAGDFLPTSAFAADVSEETAFVVWSTPSP